MMMTYSSDEREKACYQVRRLSDIDRLSEQELELMSAAELGEIRCLLLETLKHDLKKFLAGFDEI
jgi:hypothetical protein